MIQKIRIPKNEFPERLIPERGLATQKVIHTPASTVTEFDALSSQSTGSTAPTLMTSM